MNTHITSSPRPPHSHASTPSTQHASRTITQVGQEDVRHVKRQDYLYTLLTRGNDGSEARVVQSIVGFLHVPEAPEAALQRLEKEDIRILSLTVTEKGYYRTPDGGLDTANALVKEDLKDWNNGLKQPKTGAWIDMYRVTEKEGQGRTFDSRVLRQPTIERQHGERLGPSFCAISGPRPSQLHSKRSPVPERDGGQHHAREISASEAAAPSRHRRDSSPGEDVGWFLFRF